MVEMAEIMLETILMNFVEHFLWFWIRRAMRKHFFSIHLRGADVLRCLHGPAVICANHSGWWDTFTCVFLKQTFSLPAYGMMEEKNLRTAVFLRKTGVYGIDLTSPRTAVGGLKTTMNLLEKKSVIFIFPQGKHVPFSVRPLEFKPGLDWILAKSPDTTLYALAVRYEHLWESRPQLFLNFARVESGKDSMHGAETLQKLMDEITWDIESGDFSAYETLMESSLSINKKWEWFICLLTGKKFNPRNS